MVDGRWLGMVDPEGKGQSVWLGLGFAVDVEWLMVGPIDV